MDCATIAGVTLKATIVTACGFLYAVGLKRLDLNSYGDALVGYPAVSLVRPIMVVWFYRAMFSKVGFDQFSLGQVPDQNAAQTWRRNDDFFKLIVGDA